MMARQIQSCQRRIVTVCWEQVTGKDAVSVANSRRWRWGCVHLHGFLEHDITEDELHQVLGGRLQLALQEAWSTPTQQ